MKTKLNLLLAAALTAVALPAFASEPDATIDLSGGRVGIGYSWANGTLHYRGQDYPIKIEGLSALDVGAAKINATGEVYNLENLADFAGKYDVLSAGATVIGGGSGSIEENDRGVKLRLRSQNNGLNLNFAIEGMKIRFAKPIEG